MAYCTDRAEDEIGAATEPAASRDAFFLHLSEDTGEVVGRPISSDHTDVGTYPGLAFNTLTRPERGKGAEKRLHVREGAGLDATKPAIDEIESPQPKAGGAIADFKSFASLAPIKRQRQRKSVNAIDDLFQGLH